MRIASEKNLPQAQLNSSYEYKVKLIRVSGQYFLSVITIIGAQAKFTANKVSNLTIAKSHFQSTYIVYP